MNSERGTRNAETEEFVSKAKTALEAQDEAARKVRELRAFSVTLGQCAGDIHRLDQELRALMPLLSTASRAEITAVLDGSNQQLASLFRGLLNPADHAA